MRAADSVMLVHTAKNEGKLTPCLQHIILTRMQMLTSRAADSLIRPCIHAAMQPRLCVHPLGKLDAAMHAQTKEADRACFPQKLSNSVNKHQQCAAGLLSTLMGSALSSAHQQA